MKRLITILIVLLMVGSAFASVPIPCTNCTAISSSSSAAAAAATAKATGGNATAYGGGGGAGGNATAYGGAGGAGGNASSNSGATINQDISHDEPIQGVSPQFPNHLWMVPREKFEWKQLGFDPKNLEGEWTRAKAKRVAKSVDWQGVKVISSTLEEYKRTEKLQLSLNEPSAGYKFFGAENAAGSKKAVMLGSIGKCIVQALDDGADLVVLTNGFNSTNEGKSFALGAVPIFSGSNSSTSVAGGIGSASTWPDGTPGVILVLYKRDASAKAPEENVTQKSEPVAFRLETVAQLVDSWLES